MWLSVLVSVAVVGAITTVLTALLLVCEATIASYGAVTITVNDSRQLTVEGGRHLLATLKDENVFIPSACGGRGSCGLCKLKVLEGAGREPLATELPWLSRDEQRDGIRLACQIRVKQPLRIEVPEALLEVRQYRATVAAIRDLTHDIKEVRLRLADPPEMVFRAGQFIQFEVPPYDLSDEPVYRAYSMASPPSIRNEIALHIRYVPNGICTTYVHRFLKPGDPVTINGPYGEFGLSDSRRPILLIAGGSGMAPIRSILLDMAEHGNSRATRYFFGARARRDLFLVEEMRELEQRLPGFRFIPALSAPEPEDRWDGETGLITEVVERRVESAAEMEAYLCGSPLMIDACIEVLRRKQLPAERIFYDKFA